MLGRKNRNIHRHFTCDGNTCTYWIWIFKITQVQLCIFKNLEFHFKRFSIPPPCTFFQHICALCLSLFKIQFKSSVRLGWVYISTFHSNPQCRGEGDQWSQHQPFQKTPPDFTDKEHWGWNRAIGPTCVPSSVPHHFVTLSPSASTAWASRYFRGTLFCRRKMWGATLVGEVLPSQATISGSTRVRGKSHHLWLHFRHTKWFFPSEKGICFLRETLTTDTKWFKKIIS